MMIDEAKCQRCGCALRVERVRILVKKAVKGGSEVLEQPQYEEREELSDCPRCNGSY